MSPSVIVGMFFHKTVDVSSLLVCSFRDIIRIGLVTVSPTQTRVGGLQLMSWDLEEENFPQPEVSVQCLDEVMKELWVMSKIASFWGWDP